MFSGHDYQDEIIENCKHTGARRCADCSGIVEDKPVSMLQETFDHRTEVTRLQDEVNALKVRLRRYEAFAELIGEATDTLRAAQGEGRD